MHTYVQEIVSESARRQLGRLAAAANDLGVADRLRVTLYVRRLGKIRGWTHEDLSTLDAVAVVKRETSLAVDGDYEITWEIRVAFPTLAIDLTGDVTHR